MKKTLAILILSTASAFAQATVNLPALTVSADAVAAMQTWMKAQLSGNNTVLTSPVLIGDTTINVDSTAGVNVNSGILIENEVALVTAKTATTFTVTRAAIGTSAAAHANKLDVRELKYNLTGASNLNAAFRVIIAERVAQIMEEVGSPAINTQKTAITNANNTIATTKTNGVQ